jgi:hypothetical protein
MLMNKIMGSSSKARGPLLVQIGQVRGAVPKDKLTLRGERKTPNFQSEFSDLKLTSIIEL